jgi:hypothetical protein
MKSLAQGPPTNEILSPRLVVFRDRSPAATIVPHTAKSLFFIPSRQDSIHQSWLSEVIFWWVESAWGCILHSSWGSCPFLPSGQEVKVCLRLDSSDNRGWITNLRVKRKIHSGIVPSYFSVERAPEVECWHGVVYGNAPVSLRNDLQMEANLYLADGHASGRVLPRELSCSNSMSPNG